MEPKKNIKNDTIADAIKSHFRYKVIQRRKRNTMEEGQMNNRLFRNAF